MTELQQSIVNEVKSRIGNKPWFTGVCLDNLPEDKDIQSNREDAINCIIFETRMWDVPNFFSK